MSFLTKKLDELTEDDIRALWEGRIEESQRLEFKRETTLAAQGDKKELRKDVSAMANAKGGRIVYGVDEVDVGDGKKAATKLMVLTDAKLQETADNALEAISPPVRGIGWKRINFPSENGFVLVIEVKPSDYDFHQADDRFYYRTEKAARPMSHQEIERRFERLTALKQGAANLVKEIEDRECRGSATLSVLAIPFAKANDLDLKAHLRVLVKEAPTQDNFARYTRHRNLSREMSKFEVCTEGLQSLNGATDFYSAAYADRVCRDGVVHVATKRFYDADHSKPRLLPLMILENVVDCVSLAAEFWRRCDVRGPFAVLTRMQASGPMQVQDPHDHAPRWRPLEYVEPSGLFRYDWRGNTHDDGDLAMKAGRAAMDRLWETLKEASCDWWDENGRLLASVTRDLIAGSDRS